MKKEEFEQQIQMIIPHPSQEINASLYKTSSDILGSDGPADIIHTFDFIARHFDQDVLQTIYKINQDGPAILPNEMVTIAAFLQDGDTPENVLMLIKSGHIKPLYTPKEMGEISTLAICSFIEGGKLHTDYTTRFGSFLPQQSFSDAKEYAQQHGLTVKEAFRTAADGVIEPVTGCQPDVMEALFDIFACCPVIAARITFDADQNCVTVEYNPFWEESCRTQAQHNAMEKLRKLIPEGTEKYPQRSQQKKRASKREER